MVVFIIFMSTSNRISLEIFFDAHHSCCSAILVEILGV